MIFRTPANPDIKKDNVPEFIANETQIAAGRSTRLFVRRFEPVTGRAPRSLFIVHGMGEHGGRYRHVVEALVNANWNVTVSDLRGYGRSEGRRAYVRSFDQHVEDLARVFSAFADDDCPTALLGHSMGGLISIRFAQKYQSRIKALALSSPCLRLRVHVPRLTLAAGRVCSFIVPRKRFQTTVDPSFTTRSAAVLEQRTTDPLMIGFVTARSFFQLRAGMTNAMNEAKLIRTPLLVLQAGADKVVDPSAAREFCEEVGSSDVTHCHLEGQYHEILNEPESSETLDVLKKWLDKRVPLPRMGGYLPQSNPVMN